jgi:hypothetical protein
VVEKWSARDPGNRRRHTDVRTQVAQSEANLAQLEASGRQADAEHDRALALESHQVLSKQDLLQSLTRSQMPHAQHVRDRWCPRLCDAEV